MSRWSPGAAVLAAWLVGGESRLKRGERKRRRESEKSLFWKEREGTHKPHEAVARAKESEKERKYYVCKRDMSLSES